MTGTITPHAPETGEPLSGHVHRHGEHHVQFYETSDFLCEAVGRFVATGLTAGDGVILIATPRHCADVERYLRGQEIDVDASIARKQLMLLDAGATLASLMTRGMPNKTKFDTVIGGLIEKVAKLYPRVRAYGEMVNLLWADNDLDGTLALEGLWNDLAKTHAFTLMCGYHMDHFGAESQDRAFEQVCRAHSHVIPATDFELPTYDDTQSLQRTIARLKQQARALQIEIAERKKAERALHDTLRQLTDERAQFETVLRQMPAGVAIVEAPSGRVILANQGIDRMFQQPFSIGAHAVIRGFHEDGRPYQPQEWPLLRALGGETITAEEIGYIAADGHRGTLSVSAAPIRNADGHIVAAVVTFSDVTEQKHVQAERIKASKIESVGLLAAGIAHDFNNILTAILGNVSLAKLLNGTSGAIEALGEAETASMRARDLTQQLLTFSKGGAPIKKLGSVADFLRETTAFALRGSNASLVLNIAADLAPAVFDAGQLSQVVNNLLINATQAMPGGGIVTVNAKNIDLDVANAYQLPSGRYLQIGVSDQGTGIAPEHIAHVFDPYFTTKKSGTGLGLATSYSIMKRHDGHIGVVSRPASGATFTLLLPACEDDQRTLTPATVSPAKKGSGRILLMDDEVSVRQVGAALLGQFGYEVTVAADGAEALALYGNAAASQQPFDLVILDLTVPGGMGGKDCFDQLRAEYPNIKAIVSSGYSTDPIMADHLRYRFAGVIAKPYEVRELNQTVYRVLYSDE